MKDHDLLGSLDGTNAQPRPDSATTTSTPPPVEQPAPRCSRKGCPAHAAWLLEWNNPKIHTPDRRKTWLACADHRDWLAEYLQSRGLLKDVLPMSPEDRI